MALIRKNGSRKDLATGTAFPSVAHWREDGGLTFKIQIGFYEVKLTHYEKDMLIEKWAQMQAEHEK